MGEKKELTLEMLDEVIGETMSALDKERKFHFATGRLGVIDMELAFYKEVLLYGKNELCEEDLELLENKRKHLEETVESGCYQFDGIGWTRYGVTPGLPKYK